MNSMRFLTLAALVAGCLAQADAAVVIQNLQAEYRKTPLGIDVGKPRLSWQIAATAAERGVNQTAYQVQVKDARGRLVWDTNRVDSSESWR